jgi:hypothetical protein
MAPSPDDEPKPDDASAEDEFASDDGYVTESVRRRLETLVPELVRRTFAAGMDAVFTTEEGLRRLTKDMRLPKEVAGYLANTAVSTKDEFLRILAREIREFLRTVNLSQEIANMLTMLQFEVKTEIRFLPNEDKEKGVEPKVKANVRVKRNRDDDDDGRPRRRFRRRRTV